MEDEWSGDGTEAQTTAPARTPARTPDHLGETTAAPSGGDRLEPWATFLIFVAVCGLLVWISRKACTTWWTDTTPERKLHRPGSVLENMSPDGSTRYPRQIRSVREELEMTLLEDNYAGAGLDEDELVFGREPSQKHD